MCCTLNSGFFVSLLALIVRFLTKRFIGDYEANTGEFLYINVCTVLEKKNPLSSHSSVRLNLSVSTGALYSRKVTLDGEEVSLQIQDTPCVALQVNRETAAMQSPRRLACIMNSKLHERELHLNVTENIQTADMKCFKLELENR